MGSSLMGSETGDDDIAETSPDGRYIRYHDVIDRCSFKVVYKGFDQDDGKEISWCQICIDDCVIQSTEHRRALLSEANLVKSLRHGNLVKCYQYWLDGKNKTINMVTELFSSGNLRHFRKKHKSVGLKVIKKWGRQILRGLHYLHTQNPPIIHWDLKCDNIFINGNHAEVKIGDLGLATVLHRGTERSIIGTPEFMAPELYNDEYNELLDIYSFGMCMLELITCECPYSECENPAEICEKVTAGVKPVALGKVKDPKSKEFIEKCIIPSSQRPSALELLEDPYLSIENFTDSPQIPNAIPANLPKFDSQISIDLSSEEGNDLSVGSSTVDSVSSLEMWRSNETVKLRLSGTKVDQKSITFNMKIGSLSASTTEVCEFAFDVCADDALTVAVEMVRQEMLSFKDVALAVELIDCMLLELVPSWKPSYGYYVGPKS